VPRAAVAAGLLAVALGVAAAVTPDAGDRSGPASHLVVIVMENKGFDDVVGNPEAPYLAGLARRGALFTRFHAIRHPSLPDYLALTGGSTFGVDSDCNDCSVRATNLADQLDGARISWKAYMEDLPHPCFTGAAAGGYAKRHDPFAHYDDITGDPRRCARIVPLTELGSDMRAGTLPALVWITPGLCHDTHDCGVATGDRFLSNLVPPLLRALGPRGALIVTWDEGTDDSGCCRLAHGGRIATIVAGPTVRPGARPGAPVDHYGMLRSIEAAFGLPPLRAARCPCSGSLDAAFRRPLRPR
jgi:hypothetical protein